MVAFSNTSGLGVVLALTDVIKANRDYLSEIDGQIGDGDHGINMAKGFGLAQERLAGTSASFAEALDTLGMVLVGEIGGSMGPLYGNMFVDMAAAVKDRDAIDAQAFGDMLTAAVAAIQDLGSAKPGDKTLMDTLVPALDAYKAALDDGKSYVGALDAMVAAAEAGKESTRDLVAKIGRASRLGERSRGVLDAGATSCYLILSTLAQAAKERMSCS